MIEDQLTRLERIRLEALAQSIASDPPNSSNSIIRRAEEFEKFILEANKGEAL